MRIVVKLDQEMLADLSFEDEEVVIGSQPGCAVLLADERVGPRVARLMQDSDERWRIEKLDPQLQMMVGPEPVAQSRFVEHEDVIAFSGFELKVYLGDELERQVVDEPTLSPEELAKIKQFPLPQGSVVKRHFEPLHVPKEELERIARIAVNLGTCRDTHELVDASLTMLLDTFNARMAWIGVRRQPRGELDILAGRLPSGQSTGSNPVLDLLQYRCLERAQHICVRKTRDDKMIGSALAVPLTTPQGTMGMVYVDRKVGSKRFQIPDLDLLSALGCHISAKMDAVLQQRQQRNAELSAMEIEVVHSIQAMLDPKSTPTWKQMQVAAYGRSGQESPGDVYDMMTHPDTNMSALMLGHVNATGASLALSLARLHSTFRVGYLHTDPPHALARTLNWLMYDEKDPATVDAFFLQIDPPSGKFRYCRAGRIGGFIVDHKGEPRLVSGADGPSIGRIRNYEYLSKVDQLLPGETMAIYSRGVATASNGQGERFSEKRFIELVCDGFGQRPSQTIQDISHELTTFFADGKHPDDITIILLHRLKE